MNVLWLSHLVPYPPTGLGVLQRSYNLIRELARAHQVYLLAFIQGNLLKEMVGDMDEGLAQAHEHLATFCTKVRFIPIPSERFRHGKTLLAAKSLFTRDPYSINWLKSDAMQAAATDWRNRYSFDLVHFDTISLAPYEPLFSGYATTLDHHNIESHMMQRRAELETEPLKRMYFRQEGKKLERYERLMCPRFDLHITCSKLDSDRLASLMPALQITDIPNGVDTDYFLTTGNEEEPFSLVFAGNMSWYPNSTAMLFFAEKVWPRLRTVCPGVQMHVIGGNPPAKLRALAKSDVNFKVHGFVPDVRTYIDRAALYVCPIMDGGGTKLKVLDALAMGKPLVAHPIACEGIKVVDGDSVAFAREPEEFVAAITGLLQDAEQRRRMSASARALAVGHYSYASIGRRLSSEMERCHAANKLKAVRMSNANGTSC